MKIELLYFEGCPSHEEAFDNLRVALTELEVDTDIIVTRVESPEHAAELNFQGSPSIVVNGVDLEQKADPPFFGCRIYYAENKPAGVPSIDFLKERLQILL